MNYFDRVITLKFDLCIYIGKNTPHEIINNKYKHSQMRSLDLNVKYIHVLVFVYVGEYIFHFFRSFI